MDDLTLAEDRPRDKHLKIGRFDASIFFQWQDPGKTPSGLRVSVTESGTDNFAQTDGVIQRTWTDFEGAVDEGTKMAQRFIDTWGQKSNSGF